MKQKASDAADEFEVGGKKLAEKAKENPAAQVASSSPERPKLPKPGPPVPKVQKAGGTDPRQDDDGVVVGEFKGELPNDLPTLFEMMRELQDAPIIKDRKKLLAHRAKLAAVKSKVHKLQQLPTAPHAVMPHGPSKSRLNDLRAKLLK